MHAQRDASKPLPFRWLPERLSLFGSGNQKFIQASAALKKWGQRLGPTPPLLSDGNTESNFSQ